MKNTTYFFLSLLFSSLFGISMQGCYYDNFEELHPELLLNTSCDTSSIMSFQTHIEPILVNSCGATNSCHNTISAGGGVILENYAGVKSVVTNGLLHSSIVWDGNAAQMPKGSPSKLNACYQTQIQKWIDEGALDN